MTAIELDQFIRDNREHVFIEVEGLQRQLEIYMQKYNERYGEGITFNDDGIRLLNPNDNKWACQLRLYLNSDPGIAEHKRFSYRPEYSYRINNGSLIEGLFDIGYRLGYN